MLSIVPSGVMLSGVMLIGLKLSGVKPSIIRLSGVMLSLTSPVAPRAHIRQYIVHELEP
jgi:hypothetical protein